MTKIRIHGNGKKAHVLTIANVSNLPTILCKHGYYFAYFTAYSTVYKKGIKTLSIIN